MQQSSVRSGYLILADISGYTAFLTGTELDHAHGILAELTALIRQRLAPPLRFVKLEGDCVFCYAPEDALGSAERVIELMEACYLAFSDRLLDMERSTTCRCAACASIRSLDLKFIAHFGSFVAARDSGEEDLTGADVIVAHRLLKNDVASSTGIDAYILATDAFLERLPERPQLPPFAAVYDELGELRGGVEDLRPVLASLREARVAFVTPEQADFGFTAIVNASPAVVWDAWMDPKKRLRWEDDLTAIQHRPNERGRSGVGATMHCAHGSNVSLHRCVDWRPFRYWTEESEPVKGWLGLPAFTVTVELTPMDGGQTKAEFRMRIRRDRLGSRVMASLFARTIRRSLERYGRQLQAVGAAEAERSMTE